MEILAGVAVDHSTWDDKLTTSNDYDDVQCHWPYSSSVRSSYWNCKCLGGKTLYFTAVTNNLLVKVLGSLDEGVTFPITVESEFSVAVGTPVLKPIGVYFNALKIQVKPAVAGVHGTLSVISGGSSLLGVTDAKLVGDLPDTAVNDLAHIHSNTDNLSVGDQAKAASISVTPATDIPDGRYVGDVVTKHKVQLQANIDIPSALSAQTIIAAPGAGYRIRITQLVIGSGSKPPINVEVAVKYGIRLVKTLVCAVAVLDFTEHDNLNENEALVIQATTADRIVGGVSYYVEAI